MRKSLLAASVAVFAIALSGCATQGLTDVVKAANDLDPGCYKNVHITATPMMLFGWAVPVLGGSYDKVCNPDQAPKNGLQAGQVLGGSPTP